MPKHGFLTPKAIDNRIKSKGLQKLRWYCEMCQKQCRDENGFKCHTMSESHQRQLLLVAENPDKVVDTFSQEFQDNFMTLVRRQFGSRRVLANTVYNELIGDKTHIHMNATKWTTLGQFIKDLGREGLLIVDETPRGFYIQYIDRDPETLARQKRIEKMDQHARDEEDRQAEAIRLQIERDRERYEAEGEKVEHTELNRAEDEKVVINLGGPKKQEAVPTKEVSASFAAELKAAAAAAAAAAAEPAGPQPWICKGLVVKIINKELADGKYYKRKGVISEVIDKVVARVAVIDSKTVLKLDQAYLETVIPSIGGHVMVLKGKYRGEVAVLETVHVDRFCADVRVAMGPDEGQPIDGIPYEDICKVEVAEDPAA